MSANDPRPVRFALVGCGNIGHTHAESLAELTGIAELTAVQDVAPERAAEFTRTYGARAIGWDELLRDPKIDAVTICTPSGSHAALGIAALEAGKHVVVEKPMDADLDQARKLQAAAERTGKTLSVISQHRFDPATRMAAEVLAAGGIGTPTLVEVAVPWWRAQSYYDADAWRGTQAGDGGGALINQAIHTVDLMLQLAGPVTRVQAVTATRVHDIEVEDVVCATLSFASGAIGTLSASTAVRPGLPARMALYGDGGVIVLEGDAIVLNVRGDGTRGVQSAPAPDALSVAGAGSRAVSPVDLRVTGVANHAVVPTGPHAVGSGPAQPQVAGSQWGRAHAAQLADVVAAIRTGAAPKVGGPQGLAALALVEAVYRAARTGAAVEPETEFSAG